LEEDDVTLSANRQRLGRVPNRDDIQHVLAGGASGAGQSVGRTNLACRARNFLVFLSAAAGAEAFRRGSRPDKVIACVAAVLAVGLMRTLCEVLVLPVGGPK
jgi:hypothetical protein